MGASEGWVGRGEEKLFLPVFYQLQLLLSMTAAFENFLDSDI